MIDLIRKFSDLKIGVVGDIMLDEYWYGNCSRISPEAPVPVVEYHHSELVLGGAGNCYSNLKSLGVGVDLIGVVGGDREGNLVRVLLQGEKDGLVDDLARKTTRKLRVIVQGRQMCRVDVECTEQIGLGVTLDILERIADRYSRWDAVVISDYAKGVVTAGITKWVRENIKVPVVVDPKSRFPLLYQGLGLLTPNEKELARMVGWEKVESDLAVERAAKELLDRCETKDILVTRGEKGMMLVWGDGSVKIFAEDGRRAVDVTGAGDTVVAVMAAYLGAGGKVLDGAHLANMAAGIAVGKRGTATVTQGELVRKLEDDHGWAAGRGCGPECCKKMAKEGCGV
jgi:rfaE bifunctional protein kinase chain/domain